MSGESATGQLRITILSPPDSVSDLAFRGWLRREIIETEARAEENDILVVKVYVPRRLHYRIGPKKLERLFLDMEEKHERIAWLFRDVSDRDLTPDEAGQEIEALAAHCRRLIEVEQEHKSHVFFSSADDIDDEDEDEIRERAAH